MRQRVMVFANLKNNGARVTVLGIGSPFAAPNGIDANIFTLERERLEA